MTDDRHTPGGNQIAGAMHNLVKIELDETDAPRRTAEAEHERAIAIYDIKISIDYFSPSIHFTYLQFQFICNPNIITIKKRYIITLTLSNCQIARFI